MKTRAFYGALFGLIAVLSAHGQPVSPPRPVVPAPPKPQSHPLRSDAKPTGTQPQAAPSVPKTVRPNDSGPVTHPDAVSREFTVANGAGFATGSNTYSDAVSREFTVANGAGFGNGGESYSDAVSRELTVDNAAGLGGGAGAFPDAVSRELTVNNAPPLDTIPPDTTLLTGPTPITCGNAPTFTFTGTDNITTTLHLKYQYRIDGGVWQGPISDTSVTLKSLSDGPHLFEVAAIDEAGNVDPTPAQSQFVVDTSAPVISTPFAVSVSPTVVDLSWTSGKPATTALSYRLQGTTSWTPGPPSSALVSTHSVRLTGLTPGQTYEAQASGADACGTVGTSAIQTFTLSKDTTPPTVQILSGPTGVLCSSPAVFTFTGSDDVTPTADLVYQYRVDGGAWQRPSPDTTATLSGLADGSHDFEVQAIDQSGNVSIPAAYLFSVNASALTISNVQATNVTATTATITWTTDKPATSQVDYRLTTDPNWTSPPEDPTPVTSHQVVLTGLQANVQYTFRVHSIDNCATEVVSPDGTFTTTDTTAPTTQITSGPATGATVCATPVTFTVTGTDPNYATALLAYEYSLDGAAFTAPSSSTTITLTGLSDGPHTIKIAAVDPAGLVDPNPPSVTFTVDPTPPVVSAILSSPRDYTATISWTTDKPTTSQVDYGSDATYGASSGLDGTLVTSHSVTLTGLTPLTVYHFRVRSADACHETDSPDGTFTTTAILPPNLSVTSLTFPATVSAHQKIAVSWVVQNSGPGDTTTTWNDDVYLSPTPALDPATATLLGKYSAEVPLAMGASYTQNQTINLPGLPSGSYYLIVVADGDDTVKETTKDDNALAMPITFMKVQTMIATPDTNALTLHVGVPLTVPLTLGNLGDTALTGITAAVTGAPANVSVQVTPPDHLAPNSSQSFTVTVTAADASTTSGTATVTIGSAEGQQSLVTLNLTVVPPTPALVVSSNVLSKGTLTAGMLRGQQTLVQATVTNTGDTTATGLVAVVPSAPWLALSTPANIGDLAPGESASVVLTLTPDVTLPLGSYTGAISVNGTNAALPIPFNFKCISTAVGSLKVTSSDEYTYFAAPPQPLSGATVTLTDPQTGAVVLTGTTDVNGVLAEASVTEGSYNITATAPGHDAYRNTVQVIASRESDVSAFLSRDLVTYQFTVVPVQTTDQYVVQLQAIFQTNVPAPVVTISPNQVDLTKLQFDQNGQTVVYFTVTNHGLIAANDVALNLPVRSDYILTTPMPALGTLAALTTVIVPVTITSVALAPHDIRGAMLLLANSHRIGTKDVKPNDGAGGKGGCFETTLQFDYTCDGKVYKSAIVYFVSPDCGEYLPPPPPPPLPGSGGIIVPHIATSLSEINLCDGCLSNVLKQVFFCLASFGGGFVKDAAAKCLYTISVGKTACDDGINTDISEGKKPTGVTVASCIVGYYGGFLDCLEVATVIAGVVVDSEALAAIDALGGGVNVGNCAETILHACDPPDSNHAKIGLSTKLLKPAFSGPINPLLMLLQTETDRLNAAISPFVIIYGDTKWFTIKVSDHAAFAGFFLAFERAITASDGSARKISDVDAENLEAMPIPSQLTQADVVKLINRWNRSLDYYDAGIYSAAQVPAGQSTDFIDFTIYSQSLMHASQALAADKADGYGDGLYEGVYQAEQALEQEILNEAAQPGTCAQVKIQLDQSVAITRTTFNATLELDNSAVSTPLTNVKITLQVTDAAGNDATSLFGITSPTLTGFNGAIDGTGTLGVGTNGTVQWGITPTRDAAATGTTQYFVTGSISYVQNGTTITIPLFPTGITVVPDPYLQFHYFLTKNVYSDDPFTPQIEPAEPFSLGLLVDNIGMGTARHLTITSSQPQIVDNEKGLLINFALIGTQINTQKVSPSLMVNLGDIAPSGTSVAQFLLTSSLSGKFVAYDATFKHADDLGSPKTSLLDTVDVHALEHVVRVVDPADDAKPDFLSIEPPSIDLPNKVWSSDGTTARVTALTDATVDGQVSLSSLVVHLTEPTASAGFIYLRLADPSQGNYKLVSVVRSDGKVILVGPNAWTTNHLIDLPNSTTQPQQRLYIFDKDGTGSYTLTYAQNAPSNQPLGSLKSLADGTLVAFGASGGGTGGGGGGSTGGGAGGGTGGLSGPVSVTAVFPDALYLEAIDRSAGIKAVPEPGVTAPAVGSLVTGVGAIRTDADGERYIDLSALTVVGTRDLATLGITTKNFYGGDSVGYNAATGAGQRGMAGGAGLDPVGLLSATLGRVTSMGNGAIGIDDGYGRAIMAVLPDGVTAPAVGAFVAAAGPISVTRQADGLHPVLRVRSAADFFADLSGLQGGFLSPANVLSVGGNVFSLPGVPLHPAPPSVLDSLDPGDGSALIGRLTRYDAPTQSEVYWDAQGVAGPFGDFLLGEGYRLTLRVGESGQIGFDGFRTDFADQWISLPVLGATRIGTPYPVPIEWGQVLVTDGTHTDTLHDAAKTEFPPFLSSVAQYFDGPSQANKRLGLPEDAPDSTSLMPWLGYYVFSMKGPLALILPSYAGFPATISLSPSTAPMGGPTFTLTVTGTHFTSGSTVLWNGSPRPTAYVSPTQLTSQIAAADVASPGTTGVTVATPGPYGGTSAPPLPFTVGGPNPAPVIAGLNPSPVSAGSPDFALTVGGTGFLPTSAVTFNGKPVTPTSVSATAITFVVHQADIPAAGAYPVAVTNPAPGGGTAAANLLVAGPDIDALAPAFSLLHSPTDPPLSLTVTGSGFVPGTTLAFDGQALTPSAVSATSMTVSVPSGLLVAPHTASVLATNPGGQASNAVPFPVSVPRLTVSEKTVSLGGGSFQVTLTITNGGVVSASNVSVTRATLSGKTGTPLPLPLGDIAPGASANATLSFSGVTQKSLVLTVTYAGGSVSPLFPNP